MSGSWEGCAGQRFVNEEDRRIGVDKRVYERLRGGAWQKRLSPLIVYRARDTERRKQTLYRTFGSVKQPVGDSRLII